MDQRDGRLVAIDDRRGSRVDQLDGISRTLEEKIKH
jgi:hypothetical protein